MPVKVGNSYVSEVAYSYAKSKVEAENESVGTEKRVARECRFSLIFSLSIRI